MTSLEQASSSLRQAVLAGFCEAAHRPGDGEPVGRFVGDTLGKLNEIVFQHARTLARAAAVWIRAEN
ncbi:MAG TPA: hypothetical protein VNR51_09780 [Hyphomicrobium sp.]|nr:hypothetical protein [Hyphomicrobium sp.]